MNEHEAILATVKANPHEPTPRKVYADFLDEKGDSERAAAFRFDGPVYLLSAHEYSDWTILGIYSTRELAEAAKAEYEQPFHEDWMDADEVRTKQANDIQEIQLNSRQDSQYEWSHLGKVVEVTPES